jgi:nitroreductase
MLVALGYPAERPLAPMRRPNRRPFDDVVHRDTW